MKIDDLITNSKFWEWVEMIAIALLCGVIGFLILLGIITLFNNPPTTQHKPIKIDLQTKPSYKWGGSQVDLTVDDCSREGMK